MTKVLILKKPYSEYKGSIEKINNADIVFEKHKKGYKEIKNKLNYKFFHYQTEIEHMKKNPSFLVEEI